MSNNIFIDTAFDTESLINPEEITKINKKYFGITDSSIQPKNKYLDWLTNFGWFGLNKSLSTNNIPTKINLTPKINSAPNTNPTSNTNPTPNTNPTQNTNIDTNIDIDTKTNTTQNNLIENSLIGNSLIGNNSGIKIDDLEKNSSIMGQNKLGQNKNGKKIDPLIILFAIIFGIFCYVYFVNEFFCQIFGHFYPLYYIYVLLNDKKVKVGDGNERQLVNRRVGDGQRPNGRQASASKIKTVMKYFILYGHMEFVSAILKLIGLYFSHIKFLLIIALLYMVGYNEYLLDGFYNKIILYDTVIIKLFSVFVSNVKKEYATIAQK